MTSISDYSTFIYVINDLVTQPLKREEGWKKVTKEVLLLTNKQIKKLITENEQQIANYQKNKKPIFDKCKSKPQHVISLQPLKIAHVYDAANNFLKEVFEDKRRLGLEIDQKFEEAKKIKNQKLRENEFSKLLEICLKDVTFTKKAFLIACQYDDNEIKAMAIDCVVEAFIKDKDLERAFLATSHYPKNVGSKYYSASIKRISCMYFSEGNYAEAYTISCYLNDKEQQAILLRSFYEELVKNNKIEDALFIKKLMPEVDSLRNHPQNSVVEVKQSSYPAKSEKYKISRYLVGDKEDEHEIWLEGSSGCFIKKVIIYKWPNNNEFQLFLTFPDKTVLKGYLTICGFSEQSLSTIYQSMGQNYNLAFEKKDEIEKLIKILIQNNEVSHEDLLKIEEFMN